MSGNNGRLGCETASIETHTHRGHPVPVGEFTIYAGGAMYLEPEDIAKFDVVIALTCDTERVERGLRSDAVLVEHPLPDFGGVDDHWFQFLDGVVRTLAEDKKVLAFCGAGQGRTGTLLASLVSVLEPTTPDPIRAVRERYCPHAVETSAQGQAVFDLRGRPLPQYYGMLERIPPGIPKFSTTEEYQQDLIARILAQAGVEPHTKA